MISSALWGAAFLLCCTVTRVESYAQSAAKKNWHPKERTLITKQIYCRLCCLMLCYMIVLKQEDAFWSAPLALLKLLNYTRITNPQFLHSFQIKSPVDFEWTEAFPGFYCETWDMCQNGIICNGPLCSKCKMLETKKLTSLFQHVHVATILYYLIIWYKLSDCEPMCHNSSDGPQCY